MERIRIPRVIGLSRVRFPDEWILAFILHINLAWVICAIVILVGHATKASSRLTIPENGNESGPKLFWLALTKVFSLWFRLFLLTTFCELINVLSWSLVCIMAIWSGVRLPRLLPMIDQLCAAVGLDLLPIFRSHYR
ncbi:hypothetical protein GGI43DRAFT_184864 [Trichoderma evansii]